VNRGDLSFRLALLVALAGLLPIALVGIASIEILRRRSEAASREGLHAVAAQAAARIGDYVEAQRGMLRTVAAAAGDEPDSTRKLEEVSLDAPALGQVAIVDASTATARLPKAITREQLREALAGHEVASAPYQNGLSLAMDVCVPAIQVPGRAICATLDLLELQRQVQRIRVGESGYALAFDASGKLLAAGAGNLRAAVLTGDRVPEAEAAEDLAHGRPARTEVAGRISGWALLRQLGWSIAVEQSSQEALRAAQKALIALALAAVVALVVSIALGAAQARRMLTTLEIEERWRTAGQIASGISHDLGHRLAILQQTAALADGGDASYLPLIRDNLNAEVSTLRKFVADFADLTRAVKADELMPIELGGFAESVGRTAEPHAARHGVTVQVRPAPGPLWVLADRYLLERAALNLVYNAIEASPDGERVSIWVQSAAGPEKLAQLFVADAGGGIAAGRLPRLFDAFTSTKRTGSHVGMGLPNVRRILRAHGGEVSVQSEPGRGSTFTLSLPREEPPAAAHQSSESFPSP
jgi:signal transduction histidine kinase